MATGFNGVRVKNVRLTNNLPQFIDTVERKAARFVTGALVLGAAEASVLTPIATGNLINSRFNSVRKDGTAIVGTTGYTAEYAAAVNDPDHKQNFRRPSAEKDFLRKGFENAKPAIDALAARTLKP